MSGSREFKLLFANVYDSETSIIYTMMPTSVILDIVLAL